MNPMNRTLLFALGCFLLACTDPGGGRRIDLTIDGAGGKTVYFDRFENNRPYRVDSVVLDASGQGSMSIPVLPMDFYRIALDGEQLIVALDTAEGLTVEAKSGQLATPSTISGSVHTEALHTFYSDVRAYDDERERLRIAMSSGTDTAAIRSFNALNASFHQQCKEFVNANITSPAALTAAGKLNMQKELPLFKAVRDSLRKTMPRSGFFTMFRDQVDRLDQQEIVMKAQMEEQKRLDNLLPIGSEAPEIKQQTPDGGTLALSDLRGKVVLIDFWASWCRPCRIENPNVKRVYARYAKKGFEILGVSLDRDHGAWVKAIKDDGLPWKQVSDLGYWNNAAAQEYGALSIPYTVLVDRDGKILNKGLRGAELDARLAELFGS
jgi:peroxiredoxin